MLNRLAQMREDLQPAEVNLSPLIDIVFLLLIFFMVTSVFVEETGVEISRPSAASAIDLDRTSILLAVTAEGTVYYGDREVPLNALRGLIARLLRQRERPVVILADEGGRSGTLIRIIDECRLAGSANVSVATSAVPERRER